MNRFCAKMLLMVPAVLGITSCSPLTAPELPSKSPQFELALTLRAAKPIPCTSITSEHISVPRSDTVVPSGLVALLKDEPVIRIHPWCMFRIEDGYATWAWREFNDGVTVRGRQEDVKKRLVKRFADLGFRAIDTDDKQYPLGPYSAPGIFCKM